MITRVHSKDLPKLTPGDLVTFIEGDSWIFIGTDGSEMRAPPVGVVLSQFDHIGIRILWSTGGITMEWRSQLQLYSEYMSNKQNLKGFE